MIKFSEPYPEGEAPYSFFEWVAPELENDESTSDLYAASSDWMPSSASLEAGGWPVSSPDSAFALCPSLKTVTAAGQVSIGDFRFLAHQASQECLVEHAFESPASSPVHHGRPLAGVPAVWQYADGLPHRPHTARSTLRRGGPSEGYHRDVASALDAFGIAVMDTEMHVVNEVDLRIDAGILESPRSSSSSSLSSLHAIAMADLPKARTGLFKDLRFSLSINATDMQAFPVLSNLPSPSESSSDGSSSTSASDATESTCTTTTSASSLYSTFSRTSSVPDTTATTISTVTCMENDSSSLSSTEKQPTRSSGGWQDFVGRVKAWWSCLGGKAARRESADLLS